MKIKVASLSVVWCAMLALVLLCQNASGQATIDPFSSVFRPSTEKTKAAAEAGNPVAQYELGREYHSRFSWTNAVVWFRKSAEQGNSDAQTALADYLIRGMPGVKTNSAEAMQLYLAAANQGNASAQHKLARLYQEGNHVKADYVESLKWYRLAERKIPIVPRVEADSLVLKMTAEQIAEGEKRAALFVPTGRVIVAKPLAPLKLQGIIGAGKKAMAIINGKNFMVGDEETIKADDGLLKVKCLSITNGIVTISVAGEAQPRTLQLK
jgi:hypothetical protein